ncbi:MAG: hypothetical protein LUF68_05765 [Clostridiales bacterium]|nr:hypothetical protein [Clostridiales bacterium]
MLSGAAEHGDPVQTIGDDKYKVALGLLLAAWNGDPDSLRAANVRGMCRFVALYHGEYNPKRMVTQLRKGELRHLPGSFFRCLWKQRKTKLYRLILGLLVRPSR